MEKWNAFLRLELILILVTGATSRLHATMYVSAWLWLRSRQRRLRGLCDLNDRNSAEQDPTARVEHPRDYVVTEVTDLSTFF